MSLKATKKRSPIILDSTRLCKQCVIGCTVLPSRDDPRLNNGVALTTLAAWDETYVKFEDIDAYGKPSHRYWKDVYLIAAWNDPRYPQLQIGDKAFALYQNPDKSFTTVYYHAQIRAKPNKNNGGQMVIDFLDGTGTYTDIKMAPFAKIQTKEGPMTVPTVIHNVCAVKTQVHRNAMQQLRIKKNSKQARNKTDINAPKKANVSRKPMPPNATKPPRKQSAAKHAPKRCISVSATPSEKLTPLKKSTKNNKKQVTSESDSDSPIVSVPAPKQKTNVVNNMNIGVASTATAQQILNTRKRKYDEMNSKIPTNRTQNHHTLPPAQPPLKRQRSSRRKAQKLKIPVNKTLNTLSAPVPPKANHHLQRNTSNASTVSNISNISSTPTVSTKAPVKKSAASIKITKKAPVKKSAASTKIIKKVPVKKSAVTTKITKNYATPSPAPQHKQKVNKKRTITIKRKKKNKLHSPASSTSSTITTKTTPVLPAPPVLPTPPPMAIPSQMLSIKQSNTYQRLTANKFPEALVQQAIKHVGDDLKRAYKYCQDEMRKEQQLTQRIAPVRKKNIVKVQQKQPVPPPQMQNIRKKFKKMWGSYEIEMPQLEPQGFELFDNDLYLDNFKTNVQQIRAQTMRTTMSTDRITNGEWFVSGLDIRQKWTEPQEIGPITVGPYVVDMDIMDYNGNLL